MKDTSHADKKYHYGPVRKLQLLHVFAKHQKISGKEWAVIVVIADMSDATNGTAWPSFKYLAGEANTSERNIASVIKNLRAKGILKVPKPGNRYRSNTYQLNYDLLTELSISTEENNSTLLINSSISTDEIGSEVLMEGAVKSIYQSEHEAMDKIDRELDTDTSPSRPLGASGLHLENSSLIYPEFWDAIGNGTNRYESELIIRDLINEGVNYADILDGARRYRAYNDATKAKRRATTKSWLTKRLWLEPWEIKFREPTKVGNAVDKKNPVQEGKKKPKRKKNPAYVDWKRKFTELYEWRSELIPPVIRHTGSKSVPECDKCHTYFFNKVGTPCDVGLPLISLVELGEIKRQSMMKDQPNEWLAA
ncbi:Helix-turn-helix domain containing protein [Methylophilaceae bacterium]